MRDILDDPGRLTATDYWILGDLAVRFQRMAKGQGQPSGPKDLAERLDLNDDANLRQAIKFAQRASQAQARALEETGVAWRGIVWWLGVQNDGQFQRLYDEMRGGLTNSTDIRAYIEQHFKKNIEPRIAPDPAKIAVKALDKSEDLHATLEGLLRVLDEYEEGVSAAKRRSAEKVLGRLAASLEKLAGSLQAARRRIREVGS